MATTVDVESGRDRVPANESGEGSRRATQPCKVAYIVHTFHTGGLERCVARLVNHLNPERFDPLVICLNRSGAAAEWIAREGVPIVEIRKGRGNDPFAVRRLARVLKDHRVDVVHSHNWGTLVETVLARRLAGTPVHVHAERGMFYERKFSSRIKNGLRRRLGKWALNSTDGVIAVGEAVRDYVLSEYGCRRSLLHVIENGIDEPPRDAAGSEAQQLRKSIGIGPDEYLVGSVGRMTDVKDFPTALRGIAELRRRGIVAHLVLLGDGPSRPELRELASQLELGDHVHFPGECRNVGDWLCAMDVYINVSRSEGMSQAILEAMSCGVPVVGTRVGETESMIGGTPRCGVAINPGDFAGLAEALQELWEQPHRRRELGQNAARAFSQRFQIGPMVRKYERLYETLSLASIP